eukprot:117879_1
MIFRCTVSKQTVDTSTQTPTIRAPNDTISIFDSLGVVPEPIKDALNKSAALFDNESYEECLECCQAIIDNMDPDKHIKYKVCKRMDDIAWMTEDDDLFEETGPLLLDLIRGEKGGIEYFWHGTTRWTSLHPDRPRRSCDKLGLCVSGCMVELKS